MLTRRMLLESLFVGALVGRSRNHALAQSVEPEFVRMWEAAQRERPARLDPRARIGSVAEPGEALIVRGRLFERDARTPVGRAVVFAYQTDRAGHYDAPGHNGWRLKGWARTDDEGRFTFATIRPGPYPGRQVAAHVHIGIEGPPGQRHLLPDLLFEGDPRLSAQELERSRGYGVFANIRPVATIDNVATVDVQYRLPGEWVF